MHEPRVPANARGVVARSTFWSTSEREGERWRRGWWDAFDGAVLPTLHDDAYRAGRAEYLEHFAPERAGRNDTMKIRERSIEELREHPLNPRKKTVESVAEMRASIERHGLLQPLVTKPDGTILAGHRRFWGGQALGLKTLPCFEADGESEAKALEILLVTNEHVERPDALRESAAVAALLETPGWTVKTVSDTLGRSVHWVARRARLRDLSEEVQAAAADPKHPFATWPAEWLEELAVLSRDAQDRVVKLRDRIGWIRDIQDLHRLLRDDVHALAAAPWDLAAPTLLPKAGSCVACPKTSAKRPGLFEDDADVDVRDIKKARCLDGKCWTAKLNAHVAAGIAEAKKADPTLRVVVTGQVSGLKAVQDEQNVVRDYQVQECAASVKGAKAIALVTDDGNVEIKHAKFGGVHPRAPSAKREKKPQQSPAEKLAASKSEIAERRAAFVVDRIRDAVMDPKTVAPALDVVRTLLVFDAMQESRFIDADAKAIAKAERVAKDDAAFARAVWKGLKGRTVDVMLDQPDNAALDEAARWFARKFGISIEQLETVAAAEIPDPKWWPQAVAPARKGAGAKVDRALRRAGIKDPKLVAPAKKPEKKGKKNAWAALTAEQRLARVNAIRKGKGKGLPAKDAL
ncbi:MAG TPA: ParB/RepB/Spo0J family partition protein [Vicinamibacterales bacterium]|nr:ParB/RepB/Spo0J family partition protein [Vicinamibacterales bacterium]